MSLFFPQGPKNSFKIWIFCQFLYGFVVIGLSHESIEKSWRTWPKVRAKFHSLSMDLFGEQVPFVGPKPMAGEGPFERLEAALGQDRAPWRWNFVTKKGGYLGCPRKLGSLVFWMGYTLLTSIAARGGGGSFKKVKYRNQKNMCL